MLSSVKWLLMAMAAVETGSDPNALGDHGRAIGAYQIHRSYWQDSGVCGRWEDCYDAAYARQVIVAYWRRHCPKELSHGNIEVLARVHNGGPHGHMKRGTAGYWRQVRSQARRAGAGAGPLAAAPQTGAEPRWACGTGTARTSALTMLR